MQTNSNEPSRPTATIYQFPLRHRFARTDALIRRTNDVQPRVDTGAWYHDDAIEDAKRGH